MDVNKCIQHFLWSWILSLDRKWMWEAIAVSMGKRPGQCELKWRHVLWESWKMLLLEQKVCTNPRPLWINSINKHLGEEGERQEGNGRRKTVPGGFWVRSESASIACYLTSNAEVWSVETKWKPLVLFNLFFTYLWTVNLPYSLLFLSKHTFTDTHNTLWSQTPT